MISSIISSYPPAPVGDQTWTNIARAKQSGAASQLAMDKGRGGPSAIEIAGSCDSYCRSRCRREAK
jgi:hypothetical protein